MRETRDMLPGTTDFLQKSPSLPAEKQTWPSALGIKIGIE